jgi:hypothetical protein
MTAWLVLAWLAAAPAAAPTQRGASLKKKSGASPGGG